MTVIGWRRAKMIGLKFMRDAEASRAEPKSRDFDHSVSKGPIHMDQTSACATFRDLQKRYNARVAGLSGSDWARRWPP